ncbi:uncharacterized protein PFL1_04642 [Pseudozyma flocculosa PF-1]|uniref:Uncharacterized protein n=1 Tax=Pseudozyma flocculosa PF-1 TaxID=1277687 RepID=A0A061H5J5_9BASI|nr:uncharacterized protein PFL1_04642 [Pseudozyma flocculosa PF-1]EPQ27898.1 hypothetical protein PFL1_04642 [Pseudozyma flocculosa PF-1]
MNMILLTVGRSCPRQARLALVRYQSSYPRRHCRLEGICGDVLSFNIEPAINCLGDLEIVLVCGSTVPQRRFSSARTARAASQTRASTPSRPLSGRSSEPPSSPATPPRRLRMSSPTSSALCGNHRR